MKKNFWYQKMQVGICTLGLAWVGASAEAEQELRLSDLLNLKVSGVSMNAEAFNETPMSVYVVSREELERWNPRSLYELYQRVPGYSFYNTDYYGQLGVIGRGSESLWRYGFSIELMPIVDYGHWEFTPHFFKSAEIARGPAGLVWGSSAQAGLTNLHVRDDLEGTEVIAEAGNFNRKSFDFMYGNQLGDEEKNRFFLGWHYESQDPEVFKDVEAYGGEKIELRTNGVKPSQTLVTSITYDSVKFVSFFDDAAHVAPAPWIFGNVENARSTDTAWGKDWGDAMKVLTYRIEYHLPIGDLIPNLNMNVYNNYYTRTWTTPHIAIMNSRQRTVGLNGHLSLLNDDLGFTFGGEAWKETEEGTGNFNSKWAADHGISWFDGAVGGTKAVDHSAFLQGKYAISDQFKVLLGGRLDYQSGLESASLDTNSNKVVWKDLDKRDLIISGPRFGLFYIPMPELTFKYLYNNSARRPSGNELGYDLKPERLGAHELIAMYTGEKFSGDITFYRQSLDDLVKRDNSVTGNYTTIKGVTTHGAEWALKYNVLDNLLLYSNGSYIYSRVGEDEDPHDAEMRPLNVPAITSYTGTEVGIMNLAKVNVAGRTIVDIPYEAKGKTFEGANAIFMDLSLASFPFLDGHMVASVSVLNALDNQDLVPNYGEHVAPLDGRIPPEGRRFLASIKANF
jgi:outer membrane receptor protein involved in Fe transport